MVNPWDPFPFPATADPNESDTYYGVGEVLSQWEFLEFTLARMYSVFVGAPDTARVQEYGRGNIFRTRIGPLVMEADQYFTHSPNQAKEAEFDRIIAIALFYSHRRNEVAHSIVMDVVDLPYFRGKVPFLKSGVKQCLLVPPFHSMKKHINGLPSYAYNKKQLMVLARNIFAHKERAVEFLTDISS